MSSGGDYNSINAIVLKQSMDNDSDVHSVRSMPLQQDDDYFFYHGSGSDRDDDGESVDHIGLLISHPPTPTDRGIKSSTKSTTSELTFDWVPDANDSESDDESSYTSQDYVSLKLEIAELKAQHEDQKFRYRKKFTALITSLEERTLSLECENFGLKQKLKESQDCALRERVEARQVERLLQDKIEYMARELKVLQSINERCKDWKDMRRSTTSSDGRSCFQEKDYVPFPLSAEANRRRSFTTSAPNSTCIPNKQHCERERRPSLLDSLRKSFRRGGSTTSVPSIVSTQVSTQVSSVNYDDDLGTCHYSWSNADEINAQTEIFNMKSCARLIEDAKKGYDGNEQHLQFRRNSVTTCSRPSNEPSSEPELAPPKRKYERRRTFSFGDEGSVCSTVSFKELFSKHRDDKDIDVDSELWDDDNYKKLFGRQ